MRRHPFGILPRRIRILCGFTVALVILLLFHSLVVQNFTDYTYLLWNFLLAALPALWIYIIPTIERIHGRFLRLTIFVITALIWLALLPNTFYLLTEFTHLNPHVLVNLPHNQTMGSIAYGRGSGLYVLDSLMMLLTALFGAYTGGMALWDGYAIARKRLSRRVAQVLLMLVLLVVPLGVYIGRYGRWNSWDVVVHPGQIVTSLLSLLDHAPTRDTFAVFCLAIVLFELSSLYATHKLALTDATSQ